MMFAEKNHINFNLIIPPLPLKDGGDKVIHSYELHGDRCLIIYLFGDHVDFAKLSLLKDFAINNQLKFYVIARNQEMLRQVTNLTTGAWRHSNSEDFFISIPGKVAAQCQLSYGVFVNETGKITSLIPNLNRVESKELEAIQLHKVRPQATEITEQHAPVMVVENVFTPSECDDIISYYKSHTQHQATVGNKVNLGSKIRTDCFISRKDCPQIDRIFLRNLMPEIQRVYGIVPTHRENYKIGCYKAKEHGFYKPHRDKFKGSRELEQTYRQLSFTINLNDGFEGGGIYFPEFNHKSYVVPKGAACVFPSQLLHGVYPVTSGERYILVCFCYDSNSHKLRQIHLKQFDENIYKDVGARDYQINQNLFAEEYSQYEKNLRRLSPTITLADFDQ